MKKPNSGTIIAIVILGGLILLWGMIQFPSLIVPAAIKNEKLARETMLRLSYSENVYKRLHNNQFGTLEQLKQADLLKGFEGDVKNGYKFELKEQNQSFVIVASPVKHSTLTYYLSEKGVIYTDLGEGQICLLEEGCSINVRAKSADENKSNGK